METGHAPPQRGIRRPCAVPRLPGPVAAMRGTRMYAHMSCVHGMGRYTTCHKKVIIFPHKKPLLTSGDMDILATRCHAWVITKRVVPLPQAGMREES
ncbi:hypothetical protein BGC31_12400 [Komagataeibacter xylinus]|nr:hypothetical protein BGC31_12400 [Komagataeibacter xylinus]